MPACIVSNRLNEPHRVVCYEVLNLPSQVWVPTRKIRLGSSLSRHLHEIGPHVISVGSERKSSNTCTVG
jgi:hypothetical protein